MPPRLVRQSVWIVPALVCVIVFWPGVEAWFQRDDFAWLGLRLEVFTAADLWHAMFAPKAQGTIRPWSERGFFMLYSKLFGLDALPYRLTVFATQVLALFLLSRVARRLSGSTLAAFLAPLFWGVNAALGTPLSWTSAYNQVMCSAFLLGAFLLWLDYAETGRLRSYVLQFVVFALGLGALEIDIIYPGLVIAWCVLSGSWRRLPAVVPMAALSAAYYAYHSSVAPKAGSGPYALHVDASMIRTLGTYWLDAFGGLGLASLEVPAWFIGLGRVAPWVLTVALAMSVAVAVWRRHWVALFGLAWFLAAIAPVLPLRDHISTYYLTIPTIGLALAGTEAVSSAWRWRPWAGVAALAVSLVFYVLPSAYAGHGEAAYNGERSKEVELMVYGAQRARELHPDKVILLADVSTDLFWSGINDKPFRLLDLENIFLAPGAEDGIQEFPALGDVKAFLFPAGQVGQLLEEGKAVVYSVGGGQLRNVTRVYQAIAASRFKPALASRVEAGNPLFARYLLEGWYSIENGNRWMARRATLELRGPEAPGQRLTLQGYLPQAILAKGPVRLTVRVDDRLFPPVVLDQPDSEFIKDFPLPDEAVGKPRLTIALELDHAIIPAGEDRELGLVFGTIAVH